MCLKIRDKKLKMLNIIGKMWKQDASLVYFSHHWFSIVQNPKLELCGYLNYCHCICPMKKTKMMISLCDVFLQGLSLAYLFCIAHLPKND